MVFILITHLQLFVQQQVTDAFADLWQCHHRYAFFDSTTQQSRTTTPTYSARHDDANPSNCKPGNRQDRTRFSHGENFSRCDTLVLDHSRVFVQVGRFIVPRKIIIASRFAIILAPLAHDQRLFITDFTFNLCTNLVCHKVKFSLRYFGPTPLYHI